MNHRVHLVHRLGAAALGIGLLVFGVLGLLLGTPWAFASTPLWGLSTNGALSAISIVAGIILLTTSAWGGTVASNSSTAFGVLFLVSGIAHLGIMHTQWNVLGFALANCLFSLVVGLVLLFLGLYGRFSGGLPPDNPYRRAHPVRADRPDPDEQLRAEREQ